MKIATFYSSKHFNKNIFVYTREIKYHLLAFLFPRVSILNRFPLKRKGKTYYVVIHCKELVKTNVTGSLSGYKI
jgi:hypothetical protein